LVCLEGIKAANQKGITVSCDLNFRKNLWKWGKKAGEVMPDLVSGCDIILGNEEDAEKVFGISRKGLFQQGCNCFEYKSVCVKLMNQFQGQKRL
jgi:2-dehydro-3-deoxygluconokinase